MLDQPAAYHSEANTPCAKCLNKSIEAEYCLRECYRVDSNYTNTGDTEFKALRFEIK